MSEIEELFRGSSVLITGATGFLGQILVEKLLRSCHQLENIYLLVRPKKGKTEQERFQKLFDGHLYVPLKKQRPGFLKKVHLIMGDLMSPGLGISEVDREILKQNVNFVFHVGATVRFDEPLRNAFYINVRATRDLLLLSREMRDLKAFVHVSTAYANCTRKDVKEDFYEPGMKCDELEQLINSLDDEILDAITPVLLDTWPNTYAYTKCIAEDAVRDYGRGFPVAILRPSIVLPTVKEPLGYWINNVYGAAGVASGAAMGLIRVMRADSNAISDLVPCDLVMNCAIAAAWDVASRKSNDILILNYVSGNQQPITFGTYMYYLSTFRSIPSRIAIWHYFLVLIKNRFLCNIAAFLLHTVPAILVDLTAVLLRKQPRLMKGYIKIHKFIEVLAYFSIREWVFKNDNVMDLWNRMPVADKKIFDFDIEGLDWLEYLFFMLRGMRFYTFEQDFENIDKDIAHERRLKYLHYGTVTLIMSLFTWMFYRILLDSVDTILQPDKFVQ